MIVNWKKKKKRTFFHVNWKKKEKKEPFFIPLGIFLVHGANLLFLYTNEYLVGDVVIITLVILMLEMVIYGIFIACNYDRAK